MYERGRYGIEGGNAFCECFVRSQLSPPESTRTLRVVRERFERRAIEGTRTVDICASDYDSLIRGARCEPFGEEAPSRPNAVELICCTWQA